MALLWMSLVLLQSPCFGERHCRSVKTRLPFFMWRESSRSELVQELHSKSGGISRITCTVSTDGINLINFGVSITLSAIQRSTVAQEHGSFH